MRSDAQPLGAQDEPIRLTSKAHEIAQKPARKHGTGCLNCYAYCKRE